MATVNSHDIFDNLIGRRCISPRNVFKEVEKKAGILHFEEARVLAEQKIYHTDYTLNDIYKEIQKILNIDDSLVDRLMELEIESEILNAIPITNNIDKVNHGDLLISDMYLPKNVIEEMLKRVGLNKEVGLFVTTHGKISKSIWPKLMKEFHIKTHFGDNSVSDSLSPAEFGISSFITHDHALNPHEKFLFENGLEIFAQLMRELRLKLFSTAEGSEIGRIKNMQFHNNIPILILSSFYIDQIKKDNGIKNVFFSSRDCLYLFKIYKQIFSDGEYFLTSRISRTTCSKDYQAYANYKLDDKSMVVDLCGTGWSLGKLYKKIDKQPMTFFIHYLGTSNPTHAMYESIQESTPPLNIKFISNNNAINNSIFEICNYTTHGMVLDVNFFKDLNNSYAPILEPPYYPKNVVNYIHEIEKIHFELEKLLFFYKKELINEAHINNEKIPKMIEILYEDMSGKIDEISDINFYHSMQDSTTMNSLKGNNHVK